MDLAPGSIINGAFRVESILKGGMGVIYVCETIVEEDETYGEDNEKSSAKVAWKSFHSSRVWDGETIARFERETLLWIGLPPHPNIVKASIFQRGGRQCMLLLEYIDGGNLRDRLLEGPITLPVIINLGCQFCDGIHFLHRYAGIIHRDIKPENILLTRDDILKITDLGLSRPFHEVSDEFEMESEDDESDEAEAEAEESDADNDERGQFRTKVQGLLGTIPYLAPEQFVDASAASEFSDQFSFGVVLYEMITGRRPFVGFTIDQYREQITNGIRRPLSEICNNSDLVRLVDRCLATSAADRFESFAEIRTALEQVAERAGQSAHVPKRIEFSEVEAATTEGDWTSRGYSLAKLNRFEESLKCYERALELSPDNLNTNANMAVALRRLRRAHEALPFAERATELAKADDSQASFKGFAFLALTATLCSLERMDDAFGVLKDAAARYPKQFTVMRELVMLASRLDELAERDAALHRLKEIYLGDPDYDNPVSLCTDGVEFAQAGFWEEAQEMLEFAASRFPDSGLCCYNLGVLFHRLDDIEGAIHNYTRAIELGHATVLAFVNRGLLYARSKKLTDAAYDWEMAAAIDPNHVAVEFVKMIVLLGPNSPMIEMQSTVMFEL